MRHKPAEARATKIASAAATGGASCSLLLSLLLLLLLLLSLLFSSLSLSLASGERRHLLHSIAKRDATVHSRLPLPLTQSSVIPVSTHSSCCSASCIFNPLDLTLVKSFTFLAHSLSFTRYSCARALSLQVTRWTLKMSSASPIDFTLLATSVRWYLAAFSSPLLLSLFNVSQLLFSKRTSDTLKIGAFNFFIKHSHTCSHSFTLGTMKLSLSLFISICFLLSTFLVHLVIDCVHFSQAVCWVKLCRVIT